MRESGFYNDDLTDLEGKLESGFPASGDSDWSIDTAGDGLPEKREGGVLTQPPID